MQNNAAGQGGHNNFVPVAVWGRGRGAPGRGAPGRGAPGRGMPFRGRPARQRSNRPIVYLTGKGDLPPWNPNTCGLCTSSFYRLKSISDKDNGVVPVVPGAPAHDMFNYNDAKNKCAYFKGRQDKIYDRFCRQLYANRSVKTANGKQNKMLHVGVAQERKNDPRIKGKHFYLEYDFDKRAYTNRVLHKTNINDVPPYPF